MSGAGAPHSSVLRHRLKNLQLELGFGEKVAVMML
jgi:hypothetical protein